MKFEIQKLYSNKKIMLLAIITMIFNIFLCIITANSYTQAFLSTPEAYKSLYRSLPYNDNEAKNILEMNTKDIGDDDFISFFIERAVLSEINERLNYSQYLERVFSSAHDIINTGFFLNSNPFSVKNAEKTLKDFNNMMGVIPVFSPSAGIIIATSGLYTDIFVIVIIFIATLYLFTYEREKNILVLSRCTKRGGIYHATAKLLAIAVVCIICVILFYLPKLMIGSLLFGIGDLSRPLQSIFGYANSTFRVNIIVFLVCYYFLKALSFLAITTMFAFICTLCKRAVYAYTAMAASVFLSFSLLWINTEMFLTQYVNLNLFNMPISRTVIFIASLTSGITIFSIASILIYAASSANENSRRKPKGLSSGNLFVSELYKLLFECRAAKLLLCFFIIVIYMILLMPVKEKFPGGIDDMYYKRIAIMYSGEINEMLKNEILDAVFESKHASNSLQIKIQERLNYLSTRENAVFFYEKGLVKLTFGDLSDELPLFIIATIVISACLLSFNSIEQKTKVGLLMKATKNGFSRSRANKFIISFLLITLIYFALYFPYYHGILSAYGVYGLSAPAYSLEHLHFVPSVISCINIFIICAVIRLLILYLVGFCVIKIFPSR
jgi:hypothetical protein